MPLVSLAKHLCCLGSRISKRHPSALLLLVDSTTTAHLLEYVCTIGNGYIYMDSVSHCSPPDVLGGLRQCCSCVNAVHFTPLRPGIDRAPACPHGEASRLQVSLIRQLLFPLLLCSSGHSIRPTFDITQIRSQVATIGLPAFDDHTCSSDTSLSYLSFFFGCRPQASRPSTSSLLDCDRRTLSLREFCCTISVTVHCDKS